MAGTKNAQLKNALSLQLAVVPSSIIATVFQGQKHANKRNCESFLCCTANIDSCVGFDKLQLATAELAVTALTLFEQPKAQQLGIAKLHKVTPTQHLFETSS